MKETVATMISAPCTIPTTRCLLFVVAFAGCEPSVPDSPTEEERRALVDAACPEVVRPFFYRIDRDGKTSHLLGTRHASVPLTKFPASVREALDGASIIVTESENDRTFPPEARSVADQLGSDWDTYRKLVGKQVAEQVNHRSIAAATAGIVLLFEDHQRSVDLEIERTAKRGGREFVPLEDRETSQRLSGEILGLDQLRGLLKKARNRSRVASSTRFDLEQYCLGKVTPTSPDLARSVARRNQAWLPTLEPLFARGGVFVAVGRAHVTDRGGIVDMLRARGYVLTLER